MVLIWIYRIDPVHTGVIYLMDVRWLNDRFLDCYQR